MGDRDEEAGLGGALGVDGDGGRDVGAGLDVGAGVGGDGEVDGRVRESASLGAGEEVLDQGAEAVKFMARRVPSQQNLARVRPQV